MTESIKARLVGVIAAWAPARRRTLAFLRDEVLAQADRWPLWAPVAFGGGAAIYFGLKAEPPLALAAGLMVLAGGLAVAAQRWATHPGVRIPLALLAFAAAGFLDATAATRLAAAPRIPTDYGVGRIEGYVVDVSGPSAERGRVLIAPTFIARLSGDRLPARVRIVVETGDDVRPGDAVRLTALLNPPPRPAAPGAYDFARDAWFERIGGVGLALGPPTAVDLPTAPPPCLWVQMALNRLRWDVGARLAADLAAAAPWAGPGATGLGAAVTTSHEDWLPADDAEALRGSGLAHMLAIAGLHTAAVCGFVFVALRLTVAAWPALALRVPGKKVAAAGALIAVLAYLALSGAHPPARRAAITASVAFVAILFDRRAVSLRALSVAALVVLLLQPEAVVQPGFQMSFAATGALVALAEVWPRRSRPIDAPLAIRLLDRGRDALVGLCMVSFVAGAATGPFAIQHFNRMANYGVFANLTADFVASVVMMPALAIALPFEALDVGRSLIVPVLAVAATAAGAILEIGRFFSGAPWAQVTLPSAPAPALLVAFAGILFAVLWRGGLRWIGAPMAFAVLLWPRPPAPVGWIANDGSDAAIVMEGALVPMKPDRQRYATDAWAARRGLKRVENETAARDALFDCDRSSCIPRPGASPALGVWWGKAAPHDPERLAALCRASAVAVIRAAGALPGACGQTLLIRPVDLEAGGAAELYADPAGVRIEWSEPLRGRRPWTGVAPRLNHRDEPPG